MSIWGTKLPSDSITGFFFATHSGEARTILQRVTYLATFISPSLIMSTKAPIPNCGLMKGWWYRRSKIQLDRGVSSIANAMVNAMSAFFGPFSRSRSGNVAIFGVIANSQAFEASQLGDYPKWTKPWPLFLAGICAQHMNVFV